MAAQRTGEKPRAHHYFALAPAAGGLAIIVMHHGEDITLAGVAIGGAVVIGWLAHGLGSLAQERATILAATLVIVGVQVFFTSFLLSILSLRRPER